jgi:hypothetical protein
MHDDVSPNIVSSNEKSRPSRPSDNASFGQCGPKILSLLDMAPLTEILVKIIIVDYVGFGCNVSPAAPLQSDPT